MLGKLLGGGILGTIIPGGAVGKLVLDYFEINRLKEELEAKEIVVGKLKKKLKKIKTEKVPQLEVDFFIATQENKNIYNRLNNLKGELRKEEKVEEELFEEVKIFISMLKVEKAGKSINTGVAKLKNDNEKIISNINEGLKGIFGSGVEENNNFNGLTLGIMRIPSIFLENPKIKKLKRSLEKIEEDIEELKVEESLILEKVKVINKNIQKAKKEMLSFIEERNNLDKRYGVTSQSKELYVLLFSLFEKKSLKEVQKTIEKAFEDNPCLSLNKKLKDLYNEIV